MAFPVSPLGVTVELQNIVTAGVWTDVTGYVYTENGISIKRGRSDEASSVEPSHCELVFNNRDGRFSPRNPTGPYYGRIGRNTPVRVSTRLGATRLNNCATAADFASAPDTAGLSITGDIDLRADVTRTNWLVSGRFIKKGNTSPTTQFSYVLDSDTTGKLILFWSPDGTTGLSATSTASVPQTTGRMTVRATLDVDNGAAGRTITFYTGSSVNGPWQQLGDPVVQAGVTSIFDGTVQVRTNDQGISQTTHAIKILQGIGGTERGNPDFTAQTDGATSFVDAAGNTWTLNGAAAISNRRYRFYGEISAWPTKWDLSGVDVKVPVEASGILRRILAGSDPLKSSIQRFVLRNASPAYAYWPMDDVEGSTSIASGLTAGPAMTFSGAPNFASDSTFVSSNPILTLGGASFTGYVNPMAATGTIYVQMLLSVPAAGEANDGVFLRVYTTGTAARWDVTYLAASDQLRLDAFDSAGASILSSVTFNPNGKPLSMILSLTQNGSNIDYGLFLNGYVNPTAGLGPLTGTLASRTVGVATTVQVNPTNLLTDSAVGQLYVFAAAPFGPSEIFALRGNLGETAGRRIERLCSEEGITFTAYGDLDQTVAMGAQRPLALIDLLAECETADMGQLFESRESLSLAYRTRDSRQYQSFALALAYGNLSELVPVEDDQGTRNDITVSRSNGSSERITVDTGPLSTQAPPNGVGRYTDAVELNLYSDSQLPDHAQWRATEGTIDEPRYPSIVANLETPPFASSAALTGAALDVIPGDLITVSSPPAWLPPGTIRQHTVGQVETIGQFEYGVEFVCVPVTPAGATGIYDDGTTRYAATGSTLTSGITSTAAGAAALSITTAAGNPLWTTNPADFPLDILVGGEQITLSAISGTSSPQSATVSARSVNGVVKAQTAGTAIDVADPDYYSF